MVLKLGSAARFESRTVERQELVGKSLEKKLGRRPSYWQWLLGGVGRKRRIYGRRDGGVGSARLGSAAGRWPPPALLPFLPSDVAATAGD